VEQAAPAELAAQAQPEEMVVLAEAQVTVAAEVMVVNCAPEA
jgi:hypothetical protein